MKKKLYQFIFFKVFGWKIVGTMDAAIKKSVIVVVPHTSWYDFFIGVVTRGILGLEMNFVAKKELFKFPYDAYFRWMGGTPLNRAKNENKVEAIAKIFDEKEIFRLAIAPEGTRKKVTEWKTGFYFIAQKANVPIIPVAFDYGNKEVKLFEAYKLTGNKDVDFEFLEGLFKGIKGKYPENSYK